MAQGDHRRAGEAQALGKMLLVGEAPGDQEGMQGHSLSERRMQCSIALLQSEN
jgi:hypothetical protein